MKMKAGIGKHGIKVVSFVSIIVLIFISISGTALAKPAIKAYFNGQEATVEGVTLKVDEPFTIDLNITPDSDSIVSVILMEPGNDRSYKSLGGNVTYDFSDVRCRSGETCHFQWLLAANGDWTDGNAPVNIYYQLNDAKKGDLMFIRRITRQPALKVSIIRRHMHRCYPPASCRSRCWPHFS